MATPTLRLTTALKVGKDKGEVKEFARGDKVTANDLAGGMDELKELYAQGVVVQHDDYVAMFPKQKERSVDPMGTPSNIDALRYPEFEKLMKSEDEKQEEVDPEQPRRLPTSSEASSDKKPS